MYVCTLFMFFRFVGAEPAYFDGGSPAFFSSGYLGVSKLFPSCSCACVSWEFALQVEAKIFELQEAMADRGYSDIEIEEKVTKS